MENLWTFFPESIHILEKVIFQNLPNIQSDALYVIHILGFRITIHSIHIPYYYYDSHILYILLIEFKDRNPKVIVFVLLKKRNLFRILHFITL